jgi:hypothetical protein
LRLSWGFADTRRCGLGGFKNGTIASLLFKTKSVSVKVVLGNEFVDTLSFLGAEFSFGFGSCLCEDCQFSVKTFGSSACYTGF